MKALEICIEYKFCRFWQIPTFGCGTIHHFRNNTTEMKKLVFAGSVAWTEKKTETEPNTTEKDRTNGCGCTNSEVFRLLVTRFYVIWKDH